MWTRYKKTGTEHNFGPEALRSLDSYIVHNEYTKLRRSNCYHFEQYNIIVAGVLFTLNNKGHCQVTTNYSIIVRTNDNH